MKKVCIVAFGFCLFAWLVPATAVAAKADGPKARFFAKYDKNKNGVIDGGEKDTLRKDYAADKEGDLKRYDKDKDGKLSDEEIAAIKPPAGKGKGTKSDKNKSEKPEKPEKAEKADKGEKQEKGEQPAKPEKSTP